MATTLSPRSDNIQSLCPKIGKIPSDTIPKNTQKNDTVSKDLSSYSFDYLECQAGEIAHSWILPLKEGLHQLALLKIKSEFKLRKIKI